MAEVLSEIDRKSAVWLKLKKHLEERLDTHRRTNDGNISPEQTQKLRGQIAEIKAFLALGEPVKKIDAEQHID